jgi:hypothetical protein
LAVSEQPRAREYRPAPRKHWYRRTWVHALIGVVIAVLTVAFAGQRATAGARATLDDRLRQAGAGADAALVGVESEQLSAVRAIAFTQGITSALASRNGSQLNRLVTPLQANSTVPMVDIVEPGGRVLLAVRSKGRHSRWRREKACGCSSRRSATRTGRSAAATPSS